MIMKKRLALIILVILIPLALADVELNFISPDGDNFNGYLLNLNFGDAVYQEVMDNNNIKVAFSESTTFLVTMDSLETPATDYFGVKEISTEGVVEFLMYPVGYLQGKVLDSNGNLVPNAELNFNCFSNIVSDYPSEADKTGFFSVKNMPEGSCSIIASTESLAGSTEFKIEKGEVTKVEVILGEVFVNKKSPLFAIISILALIIVILLAILFLIKKRKQFNKEETKIDKIETEVKTGKSELEHSKQTMAISKTLSEKERKIVDYLLANKNESSQAKIRHATKIPRTSLSRVLKSLEKKKIAKIDKDGKMVSVSLSDFFLGK
jgi:uncharacterized membrane protein